MTVRVKLNFSLGINTWSEVWYTGHSTPELAEAAFRTLPYNWAVGFRDELCILQTVEFGLTDGSRAAYTVNWQSSGSPATTTGDLGPDVTSTSATWRISDVSGAIKRNVWLRGLEDSSIKRDPTTGRDIPSDFLRSSVDTYIRRWKLNMQGQIYYLKRGSPTVYYDLLTAQRSLLSANRTQINLGSVPTLESNLRIRIYRASTKDAPGLNGDYTVFALADPKQFMINYRPPNSWPSTPIDLAPARIRASSFLIAGFNSWQFVKEGKRSTGGARGAGRGRRRAGVRRGQ